MTAPAGLHDSIRDEVGSAFVGHDHVVEGLVIALLTNGHVLLEGVPGIAKTTVARSFAQASGLDHSRIQMTTDILPTDVTGTVVYREGRDEFEIREGPIFSNVVLVDEINRATPKAQSALLEAMEENTVTIEDETLSLPSPFLVVATQNPIERDGTFPLPAAQRDRFQMKLTMDIPDRDVEHEVLDRFDETAARVKDDVSAATTKDDIQSASGAIDEVHVVPQINQYVLDIAEATRTHAGIEHGISTRGALALRQVGKGRAAIHGRNYVIPDDIKAFARPVLQHRLVLTADTEISGVEPATLVDEILDSVEAPTGIEEEFGNEGTSTAVLSDGSGDDK